MTDKAQLFKLFEDEYISKVFGFCCLKTNTKEDAEDLAQDISCQIIRSIQAGKAIENFNAWVWSISNHTFFNWLRNKKHGSTMYLTELYPSDESVEDEYEFKEQKALLRRELSLMSGNYREAVVMYYFYGKSCDEIGKALGKSSGTVKWWLYDARKFIKEGMNTMREYGEKSYKPGTLRLSCQCNPGADYEPMSCVKRKSTQNILLTAYRAPVTIEELCIELGISAPYIEDEVNYLVKNQLMKKVKEKKFQTDFVILPGQNCTGDKIYKECFPDYYKKLIEFIEANKVKLSHDKFNTAVFTWGRLLWVYIHIITDIMLCKFKREECNIVMYRDIPDRPAGGKWIALGFDNSYFFENKPEWKEYQPFDGPVHKCENDSAQGFFHYWSGLDSSIYFDIPYGVFALCRDVIKGDIKPENLTDEQKNLFSVALEKKLFIRNESGFRQNYYYVSEHERKEIEKIAFSFYDTAKDYFNIAYDLVLKEYLPAIPKNLHWQAGNFLSNHLNTFVTCSLYEAFNAGKLSKPDEFNKEWLSLFASE
ncbi:MAG: RNA polymerase sigma factor [Oscillospiraceae bacterium]|nr:RNA polymerase sigma factor [Oscillospiraceae bacterium]